MGPFDFHRVWNDNVATPGAGSTTIHGSTRAHRNHSIADTGNHQGVIVIGLTGRYALRQERAKALLDDIRSKIEAAQGNASPASSRLSPAAQEI